MREVQDLMQRYAREAHRPDPRYHRPYDSARVAAVTVDTEALTPGLYQRAYDTTGHWLPRFPDFRSDIVQVTEGAPGSVTGSAQGVQYTGYLQVPADGMYRFSVATDGDFLMDLHQLHLLYREGEVTDTIYSSVNLHLAQGLHPVTLWYEPGSTGTLELEWTSPGQNTTAPLLLEDFRVAHGQARD